MYLPWIHDIIVRTTVAAYSDLNKIAIRRVSTHSLVFYDAFTPVQRNYGQCEKMIRGKVLFKDYTEIGANKNFAQGFYIIIVSESADFLCAEVDLDVNRQTEASIWVEHHCHRDMEGVQPAPRSGDLRKLECFVYYKSTAFIEVRFQFSFKAVLTVAFYGKLMTWKEVRDPFRQTQATTSWWPTHEFRTIWFVPLKKHWWSL
ncbi:uncharacterized protein LOC142981945 [Anticarsia gemmatalis]|uniref:uncharacterized protein LOC142981945 n=1 Tax=Anticarsia gemmatalis TaxID=129554 RepID=UPI003F75ABDB